MAINVGWNHEPDPTEIEWCASCRRPSAVGLPPADELPPLAALADRLGLILEETPLTDLEREDLTREIGLRSDASLSECLFRINRCMFAYYEDDEVIFALGTGRAAKPFTRLFKRFIARLKRAKRDRQQQQPVELVHSQPREHRARVRHRRGPPADDDPLARAKRIRQLDNEFPEWRCVVAARLLEQKARTQCGLSELVARRLVRYAGRADVVRWCHYWHNEPLHLSRLRVDMSRWPFEYGDGETDDARAWTYASYVAARNRDCSECGGFSSVYLKDQPGDDESPRRRKMCEACRGRRPGRPAVGTMRNVAKARYVLAEDAAAAGVPFIDYVAARRGRPTGQASRIRHRLATTLARLHADGFTKPTLQRATGSSYTTIKRLIEFGEQALNGDKPPPRGREATKSEDDASATSVAIPSSEVNARLSSSSPTPGQTLFSLDIPNFPFIAPKEGEAA